MSDAPLPPLKPLPIKDRISMIFIEYGQIDVLDGVFVVIDKTGVRTHIPVGSVACIMLEPGTRVSHAAVRLAATVGMLLVWVGEAGVRLYASGQPGGARSDRLLYQAKLALDDDLRLKVVRKMYELLMISNCAFPAHAGMNRVCQSIAIRRFSVPRTRGDEPVVSITTAMKALRSPHTRG